ncbi:MAG: DEAD/DEAH box helicase [Pseudomonadota bacterium]
MLEQLDLDHSLRLGLSGLEISEATPVQTRAIPAALSGKDLKISAETGTGKTLAYLIPVAQRLLAGTLPRDAGTLALVLVPTRELARQVLKQCRSLLAKSALGAQAITGGADFKYQAALLRKNPEILIATPGRLLEHCKRGSADLASVQTLVLDEADRMLDMGFRDDVLTVAGFCPTERQVLMLSATLKHKGLSHIADRLLTAPQTIALGEVRQPHSSIHHQCILADSPAHKDKLLAALLPPGGEQRALVFANKRDTAARLAALLQGIGLRAGCLHGGMSTEERKHVITQFRDSKIDVLCASDLAARGLDIPAIDLVVNYELPRSGDDYLHRTGRTGRAGAQGLAISLVSSPEWNSMISIQRYLKLSLEPRTLPGLKARFKGPKKIKSSGKAVGTKQKNKDKAASKAKSRQRNRKLKGKPKRDNTRSNDGFAPLTRKRDED